MKKNILAFLAAALLASPSWAAPLPGGDSDLPVDVTADTMEYSADKNTVVFHGKVEAVRGEFKMWSEKLTLILLDKNDKNEQYLAFPPSPQHAEAVYLCCTCPKVALGCR